MDLGLGATRWISPLSGGKESLGKKLVGLLTRFRRGREQ